VQTIPGGIEEPCSKRKGIFDQKVPNISAKHEGGEPEIEQKLGHPSDILDYFAATSEVEAGGLMPAFELN
jgi:hypothetical protein